jgi:hypothetical protein
MTNEVNINEVDHLTEKFSEMNMFIVVSKVNMI